MASGFTKDDMSPGSSPRYAARIILRITLALLVLGKSETKNTARGVSGLPIALATERLSSSRSSSEGSTPGLSTQKTTISLSLILCGTPMVAASLTAG